MTRFTPDNTDGYTRSQLADINAAYSIRLAELRCQGVDVDAEGAKSLRDNVAETVLSVFDTLAA
jgi:hypothetical protein